MIIKSLSRKTASFRQLLEYFHREKTVAADAYTHNLINAEPEEAAAEMEANAAYLPARSNGNVVYHEIISLPENNKLPVSRQAIILEDLVGQYVKRRCPNNLVYGKCHRDQSHLHYHLAISANGLRDRRRHWLPKADLARIQREVEAYKIETYPELGQERYYDEGARKRKLQREMDKPTLTDREMAMKRRTGQPSRKERDHATLKAIFAQVRSEGELQTELKSAGFALYARGRTEGVMADDGRKYRLRTLGLEPALQTARQRVNVFAERQRELAERMSDHTEPNRERS